MSRVWFNKTFSSVGAVIRLIREADQANNYEIVCSNTNAHASSFLEANVSAVEPTGLKGQDYVDWCVKFCSSYRIDIFIPGKEASLISAERTRFESNGTRVLCSATSKILDLLHDKSRFYQSVACTTPPADFQVVETAKEFDIAYEKLRKKHSKLCIKPSMSVYGLGFSILDEERSSAQLLLEGIQYHIGLADLRRGFAAMEKFRPRLVMQYLDGHEYSVDCVAENGRLICAVPRRKPMLAGQGQVIDLREDIIRSTRQLTKSYSLNGVFNVQFREGKNALRLLEINPRISGGIAMACLAGPNLPYLALVGFDQGFGDLEIPTIQNGLRVGEISIATKFK